MLAATGILPKEDLADIERGLDTHRGRDRAAHVRVVGRLRGRPSQHREAADGVWSETPASGCTPGARATTRSPPTCGCGCAAPSTRWRDQVHGLRRALIDLAERHADTIMPGFTHLQLAQPVTFGHHLMAYDAMFDARRRAPRRLPQARQPAAARRGGARRNLVSDRPRAASPPSWDSRALRPIRWTPSATATSRSNSPPPPRSSWCTCRGSRRSSCCGRIRASDS